MKIKLYTIWSEDQQSWYNNYLTSDRDHALKRMNDYCKTLNIEDWIKSGLIYLEEVWADINLESYFASKVK